ncbi:MAG: choice-of-anchor Q domain-containing protein [Anaerolineales bacterium]
MSFSQCEVFEVEFNQRTTCATGGPSAGFSTADALLAPLALNAPGTTRTHALLNDSPARDTGHAATCAGPLVNNLDQRGVLRPIDGDGLPGAVCNIAAFEATPWLLYLPLSTR